MTAALTALLVYSAQVLLVVIVATAAVAVIPLSLPHLRLRFWRIVTALCLGLPVLAMRSTAGLVSVALGPARVANAPVTGSPAFLTSLGEGVLWVVAVGITLRLSWLLMGLWRLRQLRRRSELATVGAELDALRVALAPRTEFRWTDQLQQPVAFGIRRPVVLLPRGFAAQPPDAQQAVACHELAHIARRDWVWILVEEHLRALLWFHPAMWWVLDEVHLCREQVVDRFVVIRTGIRKAYMEALLTFAEAPSTSVPAIAFLRRRHLAARLGQLSKEVSMSRMRVVYAMCLLLLVMAGATRAVVAALPLTLPAFHSESSTIAPTRTGSAARRSTSSPLSEVRQPEAPSTGVALGATTGSQARRITVGGNVRPPRKLFAVDPVYPEDAQAAGVQGTVIVAIVIDVDGAVSESEVVRSIPELDEAATDAVNQWLFEPTLLNGEAVEVEMNVTIRFTLSH